jgi:Protein of unknown function (DUF3467)
MAETNPVTEPNRVTQAIRVRDPQYRDIYSNSIQANMGPFDLSIIFQKATEVLPGQMGVADQVSVTFSPQHFKALVRSLNETLAAYETAFGELKISDTETAPKKTAAEIVALVDAHRRANAAMASSNEPPQPGKRSRGAVRGTKPEP